jgi:hypothetical protein
MSRPKPNVILDHTDSKTFRSEQILKADAIWAVFYDSKPFNLRSLNTLTNYPSPKYKKTSFSNPGHAFSLANRLNAQFNTNLFSVVKMNTGEYVKNDQ